jgi:hypothetical protein
VDYGRRAWGPQEEELGDKEMSPFVFNKRVGLIQTFLYMCSGKEA